MLKFIKKHSWLVGIIPVALSIGMIMQIWLMSTYNAWSCFDWSQVPNDTVILIFPVFSLFLWYVTFAWWSPKWIYWRIWKFILTIVVIILCEILLSLMHYATPYTMLIWSSFMLGIISAFSIGTSNWIANKIEKSWNKQASTNFTFTILPSLAVILLIAFYVVFRWFAVLFYDWIYYGSYAINRDAKSSTWVILSKLPLHYINSKCVMYWTWLLMTNNDNAEVLVNTASMPITTSR